MWQWAAIAIELPVTEQTPQKSGVRNYRTGLFTCTCGTGAGKNTRIRKRR
jgi:hypothetical protein